MDFEEARRRMVADQICARGIKDRKVIRAMLNVPRHMFVGKENLDEAYADHPLPIGEGQTISQPYIVALMTEALNLKGGEKVLEIGTGSGYQTAILAEIAGEVYTIERIPSLLLKAKKTLENLGYKNIHYLIGDGTKGWPEHSPYDAIIVTAASPVVPETLKNQLKDGGRLVIPVGSELSQDLIVVERRGEKFKERSLGGCRFVKLVGEYGWNK